ncbi:MAG: amidohydrolase family protein [Candidatus Omnitrophica bacterium]|nr:amidohydrolase family protein [Candidatus Omnitrophota bacterium]
MRSLKECVDMHLHLGKSRDGGELTLSDIRKAMKKYEISHAVIFAIDEVDTGPSYEKVNNRVLKAVSGDSSLIPFGRLNPRAGDKAFAELRRLSKAGVRGIKLHPRSENFSPQQARDLISEIEAEGLPIILHTSHEKNCNPLSWERIFKSHSRTSFVLAHGAKDAFQEAIAVAKRNQNVWLETSTLSYWRTSVILKKLGTSRLVFGSDLPYSHPAVERTKLDLLLSPSEQRKVYSENPKKILGG